MASVTRIIGIDPGVRTGFAVAENGVLIKLETLGIIEAINRVLQENPQQIIVEDARLRRWYGNNAQAKRQGAGSVKRDCKIWQEVAEYYNLNIRFVEPKNTKLTEQYFRAITGWRGKTSTHARDAAMLIYHV